MQETWIQALNWGNPLENRMAMHDKEIKSVHPKGNQSQIFIGRTDVVANNWLIWKDPDAGKDWRQEEKGTTEDEMVRWHHWLNGHEFGWTPGAGDGQGGLACCGSWGRKELDTTERLNWTELRFGMKTDLFQSCGHCWVFQICWHIECSTFIASSFQDLKYLYWNSITSTSPVHSDAF